MSTEEISVYPYSIQNKLRFYKPPNSAFHDSIINRFETLPNSRKYFTPKQLYQAGNLGPGSYDPQPAQRATLAIIRASTPSLYGSDRKLEESFWPKSSSPPVGSYTIPRIMSSDPGSDRGKSITSSFKSSGRSKALMGDAILFQTKNETLHMSNMGPGSHESVQSFGGKMLVSPHMRDPAYRARRLKEDPCYSGLGHERKHPMKSALPKFETKENKVKIVKESAEERLLEVSYVRNLPYFDEN